MFVVIDHASKIVLRISRAATAERPATLAPPMRHRSGHRVVHSLGGQQVTNVSPKPYMGRAAYKSMPPSTFAGPIA